MALLKTVKEFKRKWNQGNIFHLLKTSIIKGTAKHSWSIKLPQKQYKQMLYYYTKFPLRFACGLQQMLQVSKDDDKETFWLILSIKSWQENKSCLQEHMLHKKQQHRLNHKSPNQPTQGYSCKKRCSREQSSVHSLHQVEIKRYLS